MHRHLSTLLKMISILVILTVALFVNAGIAIPSPLPSWVPFQIDSYKHHQTLQHDAVAGTSIELFWTIDQEAEMIEFGIASNHGNTWLALGTSEAGGMLGANVWLGRSMQKEGPNTTSTFVLEERFTPIYGPPRLVNNQSLELLSHHQNESVTSFTFKRSLHGCDDQHASLSLKAPVWFIYAIGETNSFSKHKDEKRGQVLLDLVGTYFKDVPDQVIYDNNTFVYSMMMPPVSLKSNESTTYCYTYYDLSTLPKTHYIIAENFTVGSKYTHHVLTYLCNKPLEQFAKPGTVLCNNYREKGQSDYVEFKNVCNSRPYIAWGRGQKPRLYPQDFGKPVGPGAQNAQYMVMEVHFANNNLEEGAADTGTGFHLTLTSNPRSKQIGMLTVGKNVPSLSLPPGGTPSSINECGTKLSISISFVPDSFFKLTPVGSGCTSRPGLIPWQGLTPLSSILHMHKRGTQMSVRHVRGFQELEPFPSTTYFDFNFQTPSYVSITQQKIMPGDRIIVNCTYDTTQDLVPVPGGNYY